MNAKFCDKCGVAYPGDRVGVLCDKCFTVEHEKEKRGEPTYDETPTLQGVRTLEEIDEAYNKAYSDCADAANEYQSTGRSWTGINPHQAGVIAVHALQLHALTQQPEARGVDLSGVKRWHMDSENFREVQDPLGEWIRFDDLAHLQQAPQGDSINLGGRQIEDSDRKIMERSFQQLERQAPQGVGEAIDDGEPCGYCARPRREHAPETYCPSSLFRELPQYTPKSILDASRLPAPVKVDDVNPGDILCEKCNQPSVWCECQKAPVKVADHE